MRNSLLHIPKSYGNFNMTTNGKKRALTMSTEHTPANFDPRLYEIVDYIDNQRPSIDATSLAGLSPEAYESAIAFWQNEIKIWEDTVKKYFGEHGFNRIHKCEHCEHTGHVRYIAVINHLPTNTNLSFGHICARRLDIKDKATFRLKFILSNATRNKIHQEKIAQRSKFETDNQPFVAALKTASQMTITNGFLLDLVYKFHDTLEVPSTRQVECFITSLTREIERQKIRQEEQAQLTPCLEGKITIIGTIVAIKDHSTPYGHTWKMLVLDDRKFKVWGTLPNSFTTEDKGKRISFSAKIQKSEKDPSFGFFKRPTKAKYIE